MDNENVVQIPFVAHESAMNRMERTNKRLMILAIVELGIILAMFVSIMVYFYLPTEIEETVDNTQQVSDIDNSTIHQNIGD